MVQTLARNPQTLIKCASKTTLADLIDQQLLSALAHHLTGKGHDAKHTKDYPGGTTLPDAEIMDIADTELRVVVTKDDDFRVSHLLSKRPARLIHITCGNISTKDLIALLDRHHATFESALRQYSYIELDRVGVIVHDPS